MSYFLTEILARHIAPDRWGPDDSSYQTTLLRRPASPDIVAYKAVFRNGRRIGFVGALCHSRRRGVLTGQSWLERDRDFQEGLRIPPVKIVEGGKLDEPIRDIILRTSASRTFCGEICSRNSSLHIGAASVERLAVKLERSGFRSGDPSIARSIRGRHAGCDRLYS